MVLESFVLGTGGSIPLPNRGLCSMLLRREGEEFLFDCGEGFQINLKLMGVRWKSLQVVCITHSHADHVTGLPGLLMLSTQVEREEDLLIICPSSVKYFIESLKKNLGIYLNYKIHYILLDDIRTSAVVYSDKNNEFDIIAFKGRHTRAVWGYSFVERPRAGKFHPQKARERQIPEGPLWAQLQKGQSITLTNGTVIQPTDVLGPERKARKISYTTDTRPTAELQENLANSDLAFCEGMFKHEHLESAKEKLHMTGVEAAHLLKSAGGIKKAGLLHFSPRYSYKDIQQIEKEAQEIFPQVFCCREKMHIPIPYEE